MQAELIWVRVPLLSAKFCMDMGMMECLAKKAFCTKMY